MNKFFFFSVSCVVSCHVKTEQGGNGNRNSTRQRVTQDYLSTLLHYRSYSCFKILDRCARTYGRDPDLWGGTELRVRGRCRTVPVPLSRPPTSTVSKVRLGMEACKSGGGGCEWRGKARGMAAWLVTQGMHLG